VFPVPAVNLRLFSFAQKTYGGAYAYAHRIMPQMSVGVAYQSASRDFLDYILGIYRKGKTVLFRVFDIMSFSDVELYRAKSSNRVFFFPRYPVRPYGWVYGTPQDWAANTVYIDGSPSTLNYNIYPDVGILEFMVDIPSTSVVTTSYDWVLEGKIIPDLFIDYPAEVYATPNFSFVVLGDWKEPYDVYSVAPGGGMATLSASANLSASGTLEVFGNSQMNAVAELVATGTVGGAGGGGSG
jgi:hypothetical protein